MEPGQFEIELGQYKDPAELRTALELAGVHITDRAGQILNKMELSNAAHFVNIVFRTVRELDLVGPTRYENVCNAAKDRGLLMCPAEIGPLFHLQHTLRGYYENYIVATEKFLTVNSGGKYLLGFSNYMGEPYLDVGNGLDWVDADCFVFMCPD